MLQLPVLGLSSQAVLTTQARRTYCKVPLPTSAKSRGRSSFSYGTEHLSPLHEDAEDTEKGRHTACWESVGNQVTGTKYAKFQSGFLQHGDRMPRSGQGDSRAGELNPRYLLTQRVKTHLLGKPKEGCDVSGGTYLSASCNHPTRQFRVAMMTEKKGLPGSLCVLGACG